jgi:hypothetical protein
MAGAEIRRVPCAHDETVMRGRPKAELELSEAERKELVALTLRRKTAQALALRARIVLACGDGQDSKAVDLRLRVTPQTVGTRVRHQTAISARFRRPPPIGSTT